MVATKTPNTREEQDSAYNPGDLHAAEQFNRTPGSGSSNNNPTKSPDISGTDKTDKTFSNLDTHNNLNAVKESENASNWKNNYTGMGNNKKDPLTLKAMLRSKGPLALIVALLGGGGITIGTLLSPSLLLVQLKTIFTNDRSDATPAIQIHSEQLIRAKAKSLSNALGGCSKMNLKCKISNTMSNSMVKKFQDAGFKVETEKKFGRHVLKSMELPDGRKVQTPQQLEEALKEPHIQAAFQQVFSTATPFIAGLLTKALTKIGLSKVAKVAGDSKEKVRESMRTHFGVDADGNNGRFKVVADRAKGLADKAGKAVGLELGCLAYNLSRGTVNSIKIAKGITLATIALTYFIAADQIMAGDADPTVISTLGENLTSTTTDKDDPTYGLAATDSTMFKAAAYGDTNALPAYAASYLLGGSSIAKALSGFTKTIDDVTGSTRNTKAICKAVQVIGAGACVAGPQAVAGCGAMLFIIGPLIIEPLLNNAVEEVVKQGSKLDVNDKTKGVKLGDAIGVGAGIMLGRMSQTIGSKPANKKEKRDYDLVANDVRQLNTEVAQYNARSEPFNIYNQYSFLGSMASNLRLASFSGSSIATNITNMFSMIPSSLASVTTASAGVYMPAVPYNAARFEKCDDPDLEAIGVDGDIDCGVRFVQDKKALYMDVDKNLDYMVDNGHVDNDDLTGAPKSDDYKKFIQYCGVDREDAYGSTSKTIEEGDLNDGDWFTGKKCREDSEMIRNFEAFTTRNEVDTMMDGSEGGGADAEAAALYNNLTSLGDVAL